MNVGNGEELAQRLGQAYPEDEVLKLLKLEVAELYEMVAKKEIFSVQTQDGTSFFPLFQFDGDAILEDVRKTIQALGSVDCWTVVLWLTTPGAEGQDTPLNRLAAARRETQAVIDRARGGSARWRD